MGAGLLEGGDALILTHFRRSGEPRKRGTAAVLGRGAPRSSAMQRGGKRPCRFPQWPKRTTPSWRRAFARTAGWTRSLGGGAVPFKRKGTIWGPGIVTSGCWATPAKFDHGDPTAVGPSFRPDASPGIVCHGCLGSSLGYPSDRTPRPFQLVSLSHVSTFQQFGPCASTAILSMMPLPSGGSIPTRNSRSL